MGSNGNITKVSNGHLTETAQKEYTSYAKTMQSNAAHKVNEHSGDGVEFGEPEEMVTTEDLENITVGVFFDGTGNNRNNIDRRDDKHSSVYHDKTTGWKWKWQDNTSYENDRTNVDHLEKMYRKETLYFSIYIEGIGTMNDQYDNKIDMGLGNGLTGIRAKVRFACEELVKRIQSVTKKNVARLTIDVFGFSRGAAAARNFVHEITKAAYNAHPGSASYDLSVLYDADGLVVSNNELPARGHFGLLLQTSQKKVSQVNIRFAGLFDTVSAYNKNHKDDVSELYLDAINKASKIVHLTAADETREKFELVSVTKAESEFSIPGVHSDVGGSYRDNVNEHVSLAEEMTSVLNREKNISNVRNGLIEQGWYRSWQFKNEQPYKLTGDRTLSNKYSLLPLHLMFEMGQTTCHFLTTLIDKKLYQIPTVPIGNSKLVLSDVYARLKDYVILKTASSLIYNTPRQLKSIKKMVDMGVYPLEKYKASYDDHEMLFELRNKYLHFSSNWDGIGQEPNLNKQGERERDNLNLITK
ncbi:Uncharacterized alpha/beta hydrolase domain [Pedobacter westerhofensis]|uniref:Uncharacterized alpha/beta hydrolase domain n=1 Tax=Pedobacter westerhofensis TaxID=425512 RepID=A0A521BGW3_9SPHI|nr:DUF2235 domain-containing protein [Pedobacter westerhofensis]SMO46322.1 Uncharacterized alpha/beta hydrolase domain [Pedobacter westerhofensis]